MKINHLLPFLGILAVQMVSSKCCQTTKTIVLVATPGQTHQSLLANCLIKTLFVSQPLSLPTPDPYPDPSPDRGGPAPQPVGPRPESPDPDPEPNPVPGPE